MNAALQLFKNSRSKRFVTNVCGFRDTINRVHNLISFFFRFCFDTVNLIILLNMRKDIIIFIFQCNWNTCNVIYSPVVSVVSSKCAISSGNSTPKLRTKPVLIAPQTAEEIHTTHDQRLSG